MVIDHVVKFRHKFRDELALIGMKAHRPLTKKNIFGHSPIGLATL